MPSLYREREGALGGAGVMNSVARLRPWPEPQRSNFSNSSAILCCCCLFQLLVLLLLMFVGCCSRGLCCRTQLLPLDPRDSASGRAAGYACCHGGWAGSSCSKLRRWCLQRAAHAPCQQRHGCMRRHTRPPAVLTHLGAATEQQGWHIHARLHLHQLRNLVPKVLHIARPQPILLRRTLRLLHAVLLLEDCRWQGEPAAR